MTFRPARTLPKLLEGAGVGERLFQNHQRKTTLKLFRDEITI